MFLQLYNPSINKVDIYQMKELEQFQKVLNKSKYIRIFIRDQIISDKLKIDEENNKSFVENLIITTKYSSIH